MQGIQIYKQNQGKYTRMITAAAVMVLGAWGCYALEGWLRNFTASPYITFGIPLAVLVALGAMMVWVVNRPRSADFLIATEGEMKKVSWSSRKEVIGSTKVVIVTTFILAAILFMVDLIFATLFRVLNIMG
jgi:preprotein translocase subunit SecE